MRALAREVFPTLRLCVVLVLGCYLLFRAVLCCGLNCMPCMVLPCCARLCGMLHCVRFAVCCVLCPVVCAYAVLCHAATGEAPSTPVSAGTPATVPAAAPAPAAAPKPAVAAAGAGAGAGAGGDLFAELRKVNAA